MDVRLHGKKSLRIALPLLQGTLPWHSTAQVFDGQQVKLELSNSQKSRAGHKWLLLLLFIVSDDDDDDDDDGVVTNTDSGHSNVQWTRR